MHLSNCISIIASQDILQIKLPDDSRRNGLYAMRYMGRAVTRDQERPPYLLPELRNLALQGDKGEIAKEGTRPD